MTISNDVVYIQGEGKENEDAFVVNAESGIYSVIDGATGLGGLSGKLAADLVKDCLAELSQEDELIKGIRKANKMIANKTIEHTGEREYSRVAKEARSSCGFAAIKLRHRRLFYIGAGDCMLFVQYQNSNIQHLTYDHLAKLDAVSIDHFHAVIQRRTEGIDLSDKSDEWIAGMLSKARADVASTVIKNRRKLNSPEGYGTIDGSPEALEYLTMGSVPLQDAKKILLLSDGLQLPVPAAQAATAWEETAEFAFAYGLKSLLEQVEQLEYEDRACLTYPRLKVADDKTGILISLD